MFALASGQRFNSYFLFYGSLFFGIVYITTLRYAHTLLTGKLLEKAGYRRRALLVGSGKHIEAVAHALAGRSHTPVDLRTGCARWANSSSCPMCSHANASRK